MAKNRDDFLKTTVDILAKRVGYLCSKPDCRRPTVGPHTDVDRATIIGIAAHITAAAVGGPRYDENLTPQQRKHIDNAIWLCSDHSILIDKDKDAFPPSLLQEWKRQAEQERRDALWGTPASTTTTTTTTTTTVPVPNPLSGPPYLEAELLWTSSGRFNRGYDPKKSFERFGKDVIDFSEAKAMIHRWLLKWDFSIVVYNNSRYPAYNIGLRPLGEKQFTSIERLSNINNLASLDYLDLTARYQEYFEGTWEEADALREPRVPSALIGLTMELVYQDEARRQHTTRLTVTGSPGYLINERM
jgi:hypothetical protein